MKFVFMGTPEFAVPSLRAVNDADMEISLVVTQPDRKKGRGNIVQAPPVKTSAQELNIKLLQPETLKDKGIIRQLMGIRPQAIIVVAYGQLIPKEILDIPQYGCINVHASLLPKYRGAAPIHWAVINGEAKTGISIMQLDEGFDTGPILAQQEVIIDGDDTTGSLHDKLAHVGARLLVETLKKLPKGISSSAQIEEFATYAPKLTRDIERITWFKTAFEIHNLIRGLNPWPGAYTTLNGEYIKIWQSKIFDEQKVEGPPGTIVNANYHGGIIVQGGKGLIDIRELQLAGKRRLTAQNFLLGFALKEGDIFV
ncbi:MAG: methionyl-tRNA formyltransferase [Bacillota bacterium]